MLLDENPSKFYIDTKQKQDGGIIYVVCVSTIDMNIAHVTDINGVVSIAQAAEKIVARSKSIY